MKHTIIILAVASILVMQGCKNGNTGKTSAQATSNTKDSCKDKCCEAKKEPDACCASGKHEKAASFSCSLSSPELKKRRATVLESLRKQILEKKELNNGYAFKFNGDDKTIDELASFIKTERECCSFFSFILKADGAKKEAWLELTGEEGIKDFINMELEFY